MCEDPDSVLTHRLDTRRDYCGLEAYLLELELAWQAIERLLFSSPRGMAETLRGRESSWLCGSVVFYDEIKSDLISDLERIEYLKRITMQEPKKPPRVRACPRPLHSERKARDAARRGHERRERGSRPTRARP